MTDHNQKISLISLNDTLDFLITNYNHLYSIAELLDDKVDLAFTIEELTTYWEQPFYDGLFIPGILTPEETDATLNSALDHLIELSTKAFRWMNDFKSQPVEHYPKTKICIIDPLANVDLVMNSAAQIVFWLNTVKVELALYVDIHNDITRTRFMEARYFKLLRRVVRFVEPNRGSLNPDRVSILWEAGVMVSRNEGLPTLLELVFDGVGKIAIDTRTIYHSIDR